MRLGRILKILTLVLLVSHVVEAAPGDPAPESLLGELDQNQVADELVPERHIPTQSQKVSGRLAIGNLEQYKSVTGFGAGYEALKFSPHETAQVYGVSILQASEGPHLWGLHWQKHFYCCLGEYQEAYWGYGVGALYSTNEQLATLVNVDRYHLRIVGGFEDLGGRGRQYGVEGQVLISPLGLSLGASFGYLF